MKESLKGIPPKRFILTSFLSAVLFLILTAAVVYASGGGEGEGHHASKWISFGWKFLNVAVLFGVLYWLSAKAIKGFFVGRRDSVKTSLEEAIALKEESQNKFNEYSAKLDEATGEIEGISEMIKAQGLAEREKILADAEKTAEKMKEDAKARMDQEFKKMRNELRAEASELSVQIAEELLKKNIKKNDHEVMVEDFLDRMVKIN